VQAPPTFEAVRLKLWPWSISMTAEPVRVSLSARSLALRLSCGMGTMESGFPT
jgi:hypothetical protein